jgi:hypothetical protein
MIIKSPFPAGCGRGKAIATLIREALAGRAAQSLALGELGATAGYCYYYV